MKRPATPLLVVVLCGLLGMALFASSDSQPNRSAAQNAALYHAVGQSNQSGGVLTIGSANPCDSFDPAVSFDPWCTQVQRLYSRNLFAFAGQPGAKGNEVIPDLAAKPALHSRDFMRWQVTLRKNLFWSNGTPITSRDVTYSLERLFDSALQSPVPNSVLCLFSTCRDGLPTYKGPGNSPKKRVGLDSVTAQGDWVIHFRLKLPTPDFERILAMPQLAPIDSSRAMALRSTKKAYASQPSSSGPYTLKYGVGSIIATFTRNLNWDQGTDAIRSPRVDKFVWRQFPSQRRVEEALTSGTIDLAIGSGLSRGTTNRLLSEPSSAKYIDEVPISSINFLALVRRTSPMKRLDCRKAIFYALDKGDIVNVRGGPTVSKIATTLIPPFVAGWSNQDDSYPSGEHGNLSLARSALLKCGYPDGFEVNLAYLDLGVGRQTYLSIQRALTRVGIIVNPVPFEDFASYFSTGVGSPKTVKRKQIDAILASWGPDAPTVSSFWTPLISSRHIRTQGNQNVALLDNAEIDSSLAQLSIAPDLASQIRLSRRISAQVSALAVYVPINVDNYAIFRPKRLANVYIQPHSGYGYDMVNLANVTNR